MGDRGAVLLTLLADGHVAQSLTCEFLRDDEQLVALWGFRVESFVDGEMLLLQGEDLIALDVREGCVTRDQRHSPPPPLPLAVPASATRSKDEGPYSH